MFLFASTLLHCILASVYGEQVSDDLSTEPLLPPLLYLYDEGGSSCPQEQLLLVRTGHVWRVFRAKAMFTREPSAVMVSLLAKQALDPYGRHRCSTKSQYEDAAKHELDRLGGGEVMPGLCHFYNASQPWHHLVSSLSLRQRCSGRLLGVLTHADHEVLTEAAIIAPLRKQLAEAFPQGHGWNSAALHDALEARALKWRWGTHISVSNSCSRACCLECGFCSWPDQLDLPWLLDDLFKNDHEVRFLNWGCGDFSEVDPLYPFVFEKRRRTAAPWNVNGLCVELGADEAEGAKKRLESAGVLRVEVLQKRLVPDEQAILDLLRRGNRDELLPVDILKVDIDSFDLEVTLATLDAHLQLTAQLPVALVVEVSDIFPPPVEVTVSTIGPRKGSCLNSLAAYVAQVWGYGYRLHRISYGNVVFLQKTALLDAAEDSVQDEWNCFFESTGHRKPREFRFARELLQADPLHAQQLLLDWCGMKRGRLMVQ